MERQLDKGRIFENAGGGATIRGLPLVDRLKISILIGRELGRQKAVKACADRLHDIVLGISAYKAQELADRYGIGGEAKRTAVVRAAEMAFFLPNTNPERICELHRVTKEEIAAELTSMCINPDCATRSGFETSLKRLERDYGVDGRKIEMAHIRRWIRIGDTLQAIERAAGWELVAGTTLVEMGTIAGIPLGKMRGLFEKAMLELICGGLIDAAAYYLERYDPSKSLVLAHASALEGMLEDFLKAGRVGKAVELAVFCGWEGRVRQLNELLALKEKAENEVTGHAHLSSPRSQAPHR